MKPAINLNQATKILMLCSLSFLVGALVSGFFVSSVWRQHSNEWEFIAKGYKTLSENCMPFEIGQNKPILPSRVIEPIQQED